MNPFKSACCVTCIAVAGSLQALCAPSPARPAVEAAYRKAAEAASLKFLHGILSVRAPGFKAYNTHGKLVEPRQERETLERLLIPALSVKESSKIVSFQQENATHVKCQIQDILEITTVDPLKKQKIVVVVESDCQDEWTLSPKGWRQAVNRVNRQRFETHSPEQPSAVPGLSPTPLNSTPK